MAINRIKTGGITDGTITTTDIAPGTIASDRIADDTIANAKLANKAITINGTSINLGASGEIVAGTDWQAVTVADGSTAVALESANKARSSRCNLPFSSTKFARVATPTKVPAVSKRSTKSKVRITLNIDKSNACRISS